jgi:hypothetical protein
MIGASGRIGSSRRRSPLLNQAYAPVLLEFKPAGIDRTENAKWYKVGISTPEEASMKAELGRDTTGSLNFYTPTCLTGCSAGRPSGGICGPIR